MDGARFAIALMRSPSTVVSSDSASTHTKDAQRRRRNQMNDAHTIVDRFIDGDNGDAFFADLKDIEAKYEQLLGNVVAGASDAYFLAPERAKVPETQHVLTLHQESLPAPTPSSDAAVSTLPKYVFCYVNLVCVLLYNMLLHDAKNLFVQPPFDLRSLSFSQCEESHMSEIGSFLYACIVSNSSPRAAADEYIRQFLCLQELVKGCPAFRTVLELIVVVTLTKRSPLGANLRLFVGAFLSIFDQVTDLTMIFEYFKNGNMRFANALATMLSLTMFVQLFFVWFQHRRMGARVLFRELFFTLTCLAPGVHAYNVASGREKHAGESVNARTLLMSTKCIELVFESVPGLLLQFFAYITLPNSSSFALISIFTSALTTAFSASVMFFDKDLDPESRSLNPLFYGVFPDDTAARATAFFFLFMFSVAHVLNKALGVTLFWAAFGGGAVFAYYGAELAVYFGVKLLRRDTMYWMPTEGIVLTAFVAIMVRVVNKVLIDFTAFVHFRSPLETGGLMFTLMLAWSQVSSVISVALYQHYYDETEEIGRKRAKIGAVVLFSISGSLVLLWASSFFAFTRNINKSYNHTFFGTMTASQYTIYVFRNGTSDHMKMDIIGAHPKYWESIKDEVKAYSLANWDRWKTEKPDWFTDNFIATVPDEFIPRVDIDRRRNSAFGNLLGLPAAEPTTGGSSRGKNKGKVAAEETGLGGGGDREVRGREKKLVVRSFE